ncbi:MAG: tail fiber domain-containing protein [Salibacteraceae bacterium]
MKMFTRFSFALLVAAGLNLATVNAQTLFTPTGTVSAGTGSGIGINANPSFAPLDIVGNNILLRPSNFFNPNGKFIGIGESGGIVGPINGCNIYGFRAQKLGNSFINMGIQQIANPQPGGGPVLTPIPDNIPVITWGADENIFGNFSISRSLNFLYDNSNTNCGTRVASMSGTSTFRFTVFGSALASGGMFMNSDARFKQNIQPIGDALDLIDQLQGTTYTMDRENFPDRNFNEGVQYGFIAQDLQKVLPSLVLEDEDGYLGVNYDGVVPVLVEGIKLQQSQLETQKEELNAANDANEQLTTQVEEQQVVLEQQDLAIRQLQTELAELRDEVRNGAAANPVKTNAAGSGETSQLFQNRPNPVLENTEIHFYLPTTVQQASLVIYNLEGVEMLRYENLNRGYANVLLRGGDLEAGNYIYRLIADDEVVGSKTLVLAK